MSYNEYKFKVTNDNLAYVKSVLDSLHGNSDPFPEGVVDSIYYDSYDRAFYHQCLNGESEKTKFRIRGYGDGNFVQLHQKDKDIFVVKKRKNPINPIHIDGQIAPVFHDILPSTADTQNFDAIRVEADQYGELVPAIRVKYRRFRYRVNDYRITLDTNIEVSGFNTNWDMRETYGILPHHVLEVKTVDPRPYLPLLGLSRLPQISFSKFYLGLNLLATGEA